MNFESLSYESFENLARLYVVGALEGDDLYAFEEARKRFGERAEAHIRECRRMRAAFALSLRPKQPRSDVRERLMELVERSLRGGARGYGLGSDGSDGSDLIRRI